MMEAKVHWRGRAAFDGQTGSGHKLLLDGPPEGGGANLGPRPMELLLLGLAACTAYDVVSILNKSRQHLTGCEVKVRGHRAEAPPKIFTEIHVRFTLSGKNLQENRVQRAVQLSAEKYCSASIMLGKTARITHEYEIRD